MVEGDQKGNPTKCGMQQPCLLEDSQKNNQHLKGVWEERREGQGTATCRAVGQRQGPLVRFFSSRGQLPNRQGRGALAGLVAEALGVKKTARLARFSSRQRDVPFLGSPSGPHVFLRQLFRDGPSWATGAPSSSPLLPPVFLKIFRTENRPSPITRLLDHSMEDNKKPCCARLPWKAHNLHKSTGSLTTWELTPMEKGKNGARRTGSSEFHTKHTGGMVDPACSATLAD